MTGSAPQLTLDKLGARYVGPAVRADPARVRAYAQATNDTNTLYAEGQAVPPLFAVVFAWDVLMSAVTDVVPPDALSRLLHGEHDLHLRRPLEMGQTLVTDAEIHSIRTARTGCRVTIRTESRSADGEIVSEQFSTMFVRGLLATSDGGPDKPDHSFPEESRADPVGDDLRHIDPDQTVRYAAASGDDNPIHVDEAAAKAARLPGIVLHGLCTMAMCGAGVVDQVAGGCPERLRRLAVQFSWPVFPGNDLGTRIYRAPGSEPGSFAFEAVSNEKVVVRHGRALISPA